MTAVPPIFVRISQGILVGIKDSLVGLMSIRKIHLHNEKQQQQQLRVKQMSKNSSSSANSHTKPPSFYERLAKCCLWNIGILTSSIYIFNQIILPLMYELLKLPFGHEGRVVTIWSWLRPMLTGTFSALWILPLFLISRFVNNLWFQDIAECTFRYKSQSGRSTYRTSLSMFIADTFFSLMFQGLFLIQSTLVGILLGQFASIFHLSLIYSLYSFEYKWFKNGWELHKRLNYIENNWPYFFGFGLPLAILTSIPSSYVVSGSIFSALFPFLIISSNEAKPSRTTQLGEFPLQLFAPVTFISNRICYIFMSLNRSRINN